MYKLYEHLYQAISVTRIIVRLSLCLYVNNTKCIEKTRWEKTRSCDRPPHQTTLAPHLPAAYF